MKMLNLSLGSIQIEVMFYKKEESNLRPLLILNSIEFPMPPSVSFCETMRKNGLRVVFVRRLGFGGTPGLPQSLLTEQNIMNGAASATEAAVIAKTIDVLGLENVVLLGIGTANSLCYRLCGMSTKIATFIFANAVFNQGSWEGFNPAWFRSILQQTVMTKSGFRIAANGLKFCLRNRPISFFDLMLSKSASDREYLAANSSDFMAASELMLRIDPATFFYELTMSLTVDRFLKDGFFEHVPAFALAGPETNAHWIERTKSEAERLAVPIVHAPRGGMFVAYLCPETILSVVANKSIRC